MLEKILQGLGLLWLFASVRSLVKLHDLRCLELGSAYRLHLLVLILSGFILLSILLAIGPTAAT